MSETVTGISKVSAMLNRRRRTGGLHNHGAVTGAGVAPGISCNVVDGVRCHLRCVDDDVAHEGAVQKCFVAEIMPLVVPYDRAEIGVGVTDVDGCRISALDVDRWGSGRSGNRRRCW